MKSNDYVFSLDVTIKNALLNPFTKICAIPFHLINFNFISGFTIWVNFQMYYNVLIPIEGYPNRAEGWPNAVNKMGWRGCLCVSRQCRIIIAALLECVAIQRGIAVLWYNTLLSSPPGQAFLSVNLEKNPALWELRST